MELPTTLTPDGSPVELRRATAADIPALVALLADDPLGVTREAADGDLLPYRRAFDLQWAVGEARRRGCALVQLTTDKTRVDVRRFYERLGFVASHEGVKLMLAGSS
jgi:GNAT superfamily N-acetyltransferase